MTLFKLIEQHLDPISSAPAEIPLVGQAAVLMLLTESPDPHILFTKRAAHLRHHAGEICFPGGMWEPGDNNLAVTALRETWEEVGLQPDSVRLLGGLEPRHTSAGICVTPFLGTYCASCPLTPNEQELDSLFTVPLSQFRRGLQIRMDEFERGGIRYQIPVYEFQQHEIWGFTAAVMAQFLALIHRPLFARLFTE